MNGSNYTLIILRIILRGNAIAAVIAVVVMMVTVADD